MTTLTQPTTADAITRVRRTAGIAAIVAAVAYLVQPFVVFVVNPPTTGAGGYPHVDDLVNLRGLAPIEVLEFGTIGVATIVLALAVHRVRVEPSVMGSVGTVLGILAGAGWIGAASAAIATYGLLATNLGEITTDAALQQAVIQGALVGDGLLGLGLLGTAGWLVVLGSSGRRAGVVGWPLAIVALVGAAGMLIPAVVLLVPFGALLIIPVFLVLGVGFLLKSRRP